MVTFLRNENMFYFSHLSSPKKNCKQQQCMYNIILYITLYIIINCSTLLLLLLIIIIII